MEVGHCKVGSPDFQQRRTTSARRPREQLGDFREDMRQNVLNR